MDQGMRWESKLRRISSLQKAAGLVCAGHFTANGVIGPRSSIPCILHTDKLSSRLMRLLANI